MVTPAFGWSAGDIVNSIYLIIKICEAFKEAGGATSRYEDNAVFLEGFRATLTKLDSHIRLNPNPEYAAEISQHLKLIDAPYCRFEKFMLKFQPALSSTSTYGRVRKVPKKIQWALTELSTASSKVTELKREVCDPLTLLENVLQLQSMYVFGSAGLNQNIADGVISTEKCFRTFPRKFRSYRKAVKSRHGWFL